MKWNGRSYRPVSGITQKKKPFDFQEALKPLGEKNIPVWNLVMSVDNEVAASPVPTSSPTPTPTVTQTPGASPSPTSTTTPTVTPSISVSVTPSLTPSITPSISPSVSPTLTPTNTPSVSVSVSPSLTPSITPSITASLTPTTTPTNTPSVSVSVSPTLTPSISPSVSPTLTPSVSVSVSPSLTPTTTPTNTPSISPTTTPTNTPSVSVSVSPTLTPTNTPTPTSSPLPPTPSITTTSTPTPTPTPQGVSEAQTYMSAVIAGGGTLDSTSSGATYQLFYDLFNYGLWNKLYAFYPLLGGNSSGGQSVNGKTPGTRNITWNGGLTFSTNGVVSNGTNGWGNTNSNPINFGGIADFHMSFYSRTNQQVGLAQFDMGVYQDSGTNQRTQLNSRSTSDDTRGVVNATTQGIFSNSNSQGLFTITRRTGPDTEFYKNGTSLGNSAIAEIDIPNGVIGLCARYLSVSNTISTPTTRQYAFATIGTTLTDSEVSNLYTTIQNFQTTLGRQV